MNDLINPIFDELGLSNWKPQDYQAACHMLGYDPTKLKFMSQISEEIKQLIPESMKEEENTNWGASMSTNMNTGEIAVFTDYIPKDCEKSILAHEIFHVAFFKAMDALQEQLESNGPLVTRFKAIIGDTNQLRQELQPITDYTVYCANLVDDGKLDVYIGVSEVLSEMARVYELTGNLPNSPVWQKLYRDVEQTAIELGVLRRF